MHTSVHVWELVGLLTKMMTTRGGLSYGCLQSRLMAKKGEAQRWANAVYGPLPSESSEVCLGER